MSFRLKLIYFLVHTLQITNKEAKRLILEGKIKVDEQVVHENILLPSYASIKVDDVLKRPSTKRHIILFNKPRGYESTLSKKVKDNIAGFFKDQEGLIIAGRLDKDSEGLLLLSNDGKWVENICHPNAEKEKEYVVELDRKPDAVFFENFQKGVKLGSYITRPCFCELVKDNNIRVILSEGKNRQIRRMCWNLGYGVVTLKRVRIDSYELGKLKTEESKESIY